MSEPQDSGKAMRARLSSGLLIVKNTVIQIAAQALIAIVAVVAVPLLVDKLGTERFGILSLTWVVIGYASLLDLGLGRALTKMTAQWLGSGEARETPRLFWTSILLLGGIGIFTGALIAASSGWLTSDVFSIDADLVGEAHATFILVACTVPFVLCSTALRGNLEAHQRFDMTNAAAVPLSLISYFGPVVIAFFTDNLAVVVSAVCLSRVIGTAVFLFLCMRVDPRLRTRPTFDRGLVGTLLRFGGWVTVAAIVTGVMLSLDRLIIGAAVSASAVAWYATSYEGAKQMLLISTAFSSVLFPGFAANVHLDRERTELLFSRGARATFVGLFPLALVASVLAHEILQLWINTEFADKGGPVLQLLAIGVLINGLAFVAYALIQSTRPDAIAKLVLIELPLYLGLLWGLLEAFGITGAAVAVCLRAAGDTSALYYITNRLGLVQASLLVRIGRMTLFGIGVIGLGALLPSTPLRVAYVALVLLAFAPIAWRRILADPERERISERLGPLRGALRGRGKRSAAGAA